MADDSSEVYSYQTEEYDIGGAVELVSIPGLQDVTTDNIDQVEVACQPPTAPSASVSSVSRYEHHPHNDTFTSSFATAGNNRKKRNHVATDAASWYSSTFNQPLEKKHKTENIEEKDTKPDVLYKQEVRAKWQPPQIQPTAQPELSAKPMIILRAFDKPEKSQPRFVPRQLSSQVNAAAMKAHESVVENSTRLGRVQEASLPKDIEQRIRASSGQSVADDTTLSIREKIKQVSNMCCLSNIRRFQRIINI